MQNESERQLRFLIPYYMYFVPALVVAFGIALPPEGCMICFSMIVILVQVQEDTH